MTPKILKKHPSAKVKREWITLYYDKKVSIKSIADDYGYPYTTVWRTLTRLDPKRKERKDKGKSKTPDLDLPNLEQLSLDGESTETQIEVVITALMAAVTRSKKLKPNQAITYIGQLTNALKRLRSIQLEAMLKNIDASVVAAIVRRYEPGASDLRVVEVFRQELAGLRKER